LRNFNFSKKIFIPFHTSTYEIRYSRKGPKFRIKSAGSSNYRGTAFFPPPRKGKDIKLKSNNNTQSSIFNNQSVICSTQVENVRQIRLFFTKQTQFFPIFHTKTTILQKNKANSNPIKPDSKPILAQKSGGQTQTNPMSIWVVFFLSSFITSK
jgi:hypothetical protein